jgi:hypothetical protein
MDGKIACCTPTLKMHVGSGILTFTQSVKVAVVFAVVVVVGVMGCGLWVGGGLWVVVGGCGWRGVRLL